jgi:hypothetical protein
MDFKYVASGPLVPKYKAGEFFLKNLIKEKEVAKEGALIGQTG